MSHFFDPLPLESDDSPLVDCVVDEPAQSQFVVKAFEENPVFVFETCRGEGPFEQHRNLREKRERPHDQNKVGRQIVDFVRLVIKRAQSRKSLLHLVKRERQVHEVK